MHQITQYSLLNTSHFSTNKIWFEIQVPPKQIGDCGLADTLSTA